MGNRKLMLNRYRVSVWGDEKDLEIDSDCGCVILGMFLMLLSYVLKNSYSCKFYVTYILPKDDKKIISSQEKQKVFSVKEQNLTDISYSSQHPGLTPSTGPRK